MSDSATTVRQSLITTVHERRTRSAEVATLRITVHALTSTFSPPPQQHLHSII